MCYENEYDNFNNSKKVGRTLIWIVIVFSIILLIRGCDHVMTQAAPAPISKLNDKPLIAWPTGRWVGPDGRGGKCTLTFWANKTYQADWCGREWEGTWYYDDKDSDIIHVKEYPTGYDKPNYYWYGKRHDNIMRVSWAEGTFKHGRIGR